MWCEFHTLWKQLNDEAHGKESRKQGKGTPTEPAKMAPSVPHEKAPCLLELGKRFFDHKPLKERLEAQMKVMRDWVTTMKPAVKKGLWRASKHD
jgi:hypothetical protein